MGWRAPKTAVLPKELLLKGDDIMTLKTRFEGFSPTIFSMKKCWISGVRMDMTWMSQEVRIKG